jgi:hypothetical protein
MIALLNQYSFVLGSLVLGLGLAVLLWRWRGAPAGLRVVLLAVFVMAAILLGAARRYPVQEVTTLVEAEAVLTNEQPTFVMLYSNY